MSARELSLMIGKHEAYINKLECYAFNLSTNVLLEILDALQVSPQQFFADNYRDYKKDDELYQIIKKLPADKKDGLINLLKN